MDRPIAPDRRTERPEQGLGSDLAHVSRRLLDEPEAGVSRLIVVGLTEREVVHLLTSAAGEGLESRAERGAGGKLHVTLAAPTRADPAAAPPPSPAVTRGWRLLTRLRAAAPRLASRGRTRLA